MDGRRGSSEEVESGCRRGMILTGIAGKEEEEEDAVVVKDIEKLVSMEIKCEEERRTTDCSMKKRRANVVPVTTE